MKFSFITWLFGLIINYLYQHTRLGTSFCWGEFRRWMHRELCMVSCNLTVEGLEIDGNWPIPNKSNGADLKFRSGFDSKYLKPNITNIYHWTTLIVLDGFTLFLVACSFSREDNSIVVASYHIKVSTKYQIVRQQTLKPTSYQRDIVLVTSHGRVISVKSYTMPVRWRVFSKWVCVASCWDLFLQLRKWNVRTLDLNIWRIKTGDKKKIYQ